MDNLSLAKYVRSSCLSFIKKQDNEHVVSNILSGKRFVLEDTSYKILNSLKTPCTVSQLKNLFPEIDKKSISSLLDYLQSKSLIYDVDDKEVDETFQVVSKNIHFFNLDYYEPGNKENNIVMVGIPFGKGNSISNAVSQAPQILRNLTHNFNINLNKYNNISSIGNLYGTDIDFTYLESVVKQNKILDWGDLYIYTHEHNSNVYNKIKKLTSILLKKNQKPFFVGGDHSITYPILEACNNIYNNIQVIHIDAHTDTYKRKIDTIFKNVSTHHHGNFASKSMELKNIGAFHQFGIRGLSNIGNKNVNDKQHIYYTKEVKEIIYKNKNVNLPLNVPYYLTIDIDVIDPSFAPGTSTPVPGGLNNFELITLLQIILKDKNLIGADLVEINPEKDINTLTMHIGVEIIIFLLNLLSNDLVK